MALSDRDILHYIKTGRLVIDPFDERLVTSNGVDLRLDNEFCRIRRRYTIVVDSRSPPPNLEELYECRMVDDSEGFVVEPYDHVLVSTMEWVELPGDVVGLVMLRSTFARYGLYIPPTVVNAGFKGRIVLEVLGGPFAVRLYPGQRFAQLVLVRTVSPVARLYSGVYQGQRGVLLPGGVARGGGNAKA